MKDLPDYKLLSILTGFRRIARANMVPSRGLKATDAPLPFRSRKPRPAVRKRA